MSDLSWEESGQFWIEFELIKIDGALRLKLQPLFEKFKRWWDRDGWNRLFGIRIHPSDLVTSTKAVWGKRLKRAVSNEEAIEIIRSFSSFLSLMREAKANAK
jgi:hypothetical protein